MAKCPVCKQKLSIEMLAQHGGKPKLDAALQQTVSWTIETAIRAAVGSGRSLYLTCNNPECPAHYTLTKPHYFKDTPFGPVLVGDTTGLIIESLKKQYKPKKK